MRWFSIFYNMQRQGVKRSKNCQGPFGSWMSYFWGPSQSFKGPDFLISLMGHITESLSLQKLWALRAHLMLILRACMQFCGPLARGPALFENLCKGPHNHCGENPTYGIWLPMKHLLSNSKTHYCLQGQIQKFLTEGAPTLFKDYRGDKFPRITF